MTWQIKDVIRDDNGDLKFKTHDAGTISSVGEVKQSVIDMTDEMTQLFNELYEMFGDAVDEPKAHTLLARLKGIKGVLDEINTKLNEQIDVLRHMAENVLFDGEQFGSGETKIAVAAGLEGYDKHTIEVTSSTDAPYTIIISINNKQIGEWDVTEKDFIATLSANIKYITVYIRNTHTSTNTISASITSVRGV